MSKFTAWAKRWWYLIVSPFTTSDDIRTAVLRNLYPSPLTHYTDVSVWCSDYDAVRWEKLLRVEESKIADFRQWASTLPHGQVRRAYFEWLAFFELGIREARTELYGKRHKHFHEKWLAKEAARDQRIAAISVPKPNQRSIW